jgi:hypothetical protein
MHAEIVRLLKQLGEASRHPLFITLVGFILTGIIGAAFTWYLNSYSTAREADRAERARTAEFEATRRTREVDAVRELIELINERRTRAMLVASAIHRQSTEAEVEDRKRAYDDVYVRWNTKIQSLTLRIREIFKAAHSEFEDYINDLNYEMTLGVRGRQRPQEEHREALLTKMDACITKAFDTYRRDKFEDKGNAVTVLNECNLDTTDQTLIDCSKTIADSLFAIVNALDPTREKIQEVIGKYEIKNVCNIPLRGS